MNDKTSGAENDLSKESINEKIPEDHSFTAFFSSNNETPFFALRETLKDNLASFKIFSGSKKIEPKDTDQIPSYFGAISFEGTHQFFETNNANTVYLNNKQINQSFDSKTLKIEKIENVEDFATFNHMIEEAKKLFKMNPELKKFILHRQINISFNRPIKISDIHDLIPGMDPSHHAFIYFDGQEVHISFSPETLLENEENKIRTMALAGTIHRGSTESEDQALANELLNDPKNLTEQNIVTESIFSTLSKYCHEIKIEKQSIKKLRTVQHLINEIRAVLNEPKAFLDLLNELHPTPALGGEPKDLALNCIKQIEKKPRHLYAAAIGFKDHKKEKFIVNIRNISFVPGNNIVKIYGGAGILRDSDALSEWNETENKMKQFLKYFNFK